MGNIRFPKAVNSENVDLHPNFSNVSKLVVGNRPMDQSTGLVDRIHQKRPVTRSQTKSHSSSVSSCQSLPQNDLDSLNMALEAKPASRKRIPVEPQKIKKPITPKKKETALQRPNCSIPAHNSSHDSSHATSESDLRHNFQYKETQESDFSFPLQSDSQTLPKKRNLKKLNEPTEPTSHQPKGSPRKRHKPEEQTDSYRAEWDDKDGHYIITEGERIGERYTILNLLGEGAFGKVVRCYDTVKGNYVAVKIIKNIPRYRDAAKIEIKILDSISRAHGTGKRYCIDLIHWLDHRHHICMVFRLLGLSLYDFLKANHFQGFSLFHIRSISNQLLLALQYIHGLTLTHTDLKPENILFVDSSHDLVYNKDRKRNDRVLKNSGIRLIDFGSSTFEAEHHTRIVSTRHYRAPEVIMELGWSYPCDMWSVGCILMELYTGDALFQTHESMEHLVMMEKILGPMPFKMIDSSARKSKYFSHSSNGYQIRWPASDEKVSSIKYVEKHCFPLHKYSRHPKDEDDYQFFNLVLKMLTYEPEKRITASQALQHPFFTHFP